MSDLAHHVDVACRYVILLITYPGVTCATILYGLAADSQEYSTIGSWVLALTLLVTVVSLPILTRRAHQAHRLEQDRALRNVSLLSIKHPDFPSAAERLFRAFDIDSSRTIDPNEFYEVSTRLYPLSSDDATWAAQAQLKELTDNDGHLSCPAFIRALRLTDALMGPLVEVGIRRPTLLGEMKNKFTSSKLVSHGSRVSLKRSVEVRQNVAEMLSATQDATVLDATVPDASARCATARDATARDTTMRRRRRKVEGRVPVKAQVAELLSATTVGPQHSSLDGNEGMGGWGRYEGMGV
uniref:EF-hand domain-containing protein n=1 Tax=Haptolina brevifila TaxID=156173 RepID=A0A7S2IFM0_9EUKA